MILTERLCKHYGGTAAVANLDLRIEPGEIFGFLGPNGAGKSTTVKILAGLIPAGSGRAVRRRLRRRRTAARGKEAARLRS